MPNLKSSQDEIHLQYFENNLAHNRDSADRDGDLGFVPGADTQTRRRRELPQSIAALSIALLIVGLYASVCLHLWGPRVTLGLLSLVTTVWLFAVRRPWQSTI